MPRDVLQMIVRIAILVAIMIFVGHTVWDVRRELDRTGREQTRDQREIARDVHATERELAAVAKHRTGRRHHTSDVSRCEGSKCST